MLRADRHLCVAAWCFVAAMLLIVGVALLLRFAELPRPTAPPADPLAPILDKPAAKPTAHATDQRFAEAVRAAVLRDGHFTVTLHVGLLDGGGRKDLAKLGDGSHPRTNLCWGARFGIDTHLPRGGTWRRVFTDNGDGSRILRRTVYRKRVEANRTRWSDEGLAEPFDIVLLANAWSAAHAGEAIHQPLRDALIGETVTLDLGGLSYRFGGGSVVVGYLGPNPLLRQPLDPWDGLPPGASRSVGVFFACSQSAVYLHAEAMRRGLYPILFAREPIVPEGYVVEGILNALASGELGDAFVEQAAVCYARHQRSTSVQTARGYFFR
jgi:hypothetical protein